MTDRKLDPTLSRAEILDRVLTAEREAHDLLDQAAHLAPDVKDRQLFERLAGREAESLRELIEEEEQLEAEAFVQKALDC